MAASIFRATWWPLRLAVAWALTGDRAFVEDLSSRAGDSLLSIATGLAMHEADGTPIKRRFKYVDDAWSALREEMAAGRVRASGTPFRRVADAWGHAVETNEMAREIPAAEIASLRLQDDGDERVLVPEDWRVAHGSNWHNLCGYRNVQVFREDVLCVFPAGTATAAGEMAAINALAAQLSSNPQLSRAEAKRWCREQGFHLSDRGFQIRVWRGAREKAGLESTAAPGRKRKSSRKIVEG